jgi:BRCA1-associated protein
MCLICGELGCNPHSNQHFASTGHTFFQEVETSTTWDYSRQVSISRLINSSDKIVEVQDGKKVESIMFEYNCLLSSLLETQKEFYEEKIVEIEREPNSLDEQIKDLKKENEKMRKIAEEQESVKKELEMVNSKIEVEKRRKKDLTVLNENLQKKAEERKVFRVTKDVLKEITELEEEIKYMKSYLEAQKKLQGIDIDSIEIRPKK